MSDLEDIGEEAMERIREEYKDTAAFLKRERDELKLRLHLANTELRDQWQELEDKLQHFQSRAEVLGKITAESAREVGEASRLVGDELKTAYRRIRDSLDATG